MQQSRVLLIDNNDSFTYNIIEMLRTIDDAEGEVLSSAGLDMASLNHFDHIIISPGPMTPKDFPILSEVIRYCYVANKPLLGICLGHQAIGEYFGGQLVRLETVVHGQRRQITIDTSSPIYMGMPDKIEVGLYHSWAVDSATLPSWLKATAFTDSHCLMSLECRQRPIFGIQFHPESFMTPLGRQIVENFLNITTR